MKKLLTFILIMITVPCFAKTSEFFQGIDENALKAGISKYILTRGGKIYHGESYQSNTFMAVEQLSNGYSAYTYRYLFNIEPSDDGAKLNLDVVKSTAGVKPYNIDINEEKKIMDAIIASIKGRFLYGLGFDFDTYDSKTGKIKAPKGKETGIVLTAVRYDALKKGLQKGDKIIKVNGALLKDIPIEKYASILSAKSLTDSIILTCKRKDEIFTVTLVPRLSNIKTF